LVLWANPTTLVVMRVTALELAPGTTSLEAGRELELVLDG
jgi:hypothetical protein